ncbi:MAG TPA: polyamine ABC transporter permease, partial [Pseudomonas sp.]|nr:polyamine ABC transporter permease [Pseudomonas sp.]
MLLTPSALGWRLRGGLLLITGAIAAVLLLPIV